ncbi:T9SS type A sorting domain-containing protein [Spirosoma sp. RP8]|uniref:T9SS type A sorting domain-containing protein n=1 Tax=Spirosoma liriopis TaxID=2937440 RepID=A0ABT0HU27_9BACT|nr:T9SS type A sorting domain-containing protein [Spirosoma liriopis]MCK8495661.1 T9SS type A sorting domain-containing protein [Spirosoma liriopis]
MRKSILTVPAACIALLIFARSGEPKIPHSATSMTMNSASKIPMDPKRWYQVNNVSSGLEGLFDGITDESVNTGWSKILSNYDAYYPLLDGETMSIESIRFYDGAGTNTDAPMTLSIITDKWERIPIARFVGDRYQSWVGPNPDQLDEFNLKTPITGARYLVINTSGSYPTEMELYGVYQPSQRQITAPTVRATPFRQSLGVNVFEWNFEEGSSPWKVEDSRVEAMNAFSSVRHYLDWEKLESQKGNYTFNPSGSGSWNYDAIYERCQAEGIEVLACLKTIPKWLETTYPEGERDYENVPAPYGSDLLSPNSYIDQARLGFQFAARYGSNKKVDPSLVKVSNVKTWAGINEVKIGLGLIRYVECENERDKTWKGRKAYQSAREYAANLSAFYDGHKNTLGSGVGVKNADPSMTVVIGGLAASSTDYVRGMVDWCREFRGYLPDGRINLCWDVINQHLYANDAKSSQNGGGSRGAAPELSGVGEQAAAFVALSHQLAHDMPVWITEAGYDVNQGSPFKAIAIGNKSVLETHADWTLRTALLYTRVGIDRLFFYQLYDDNIQNPTQFSSMGLVNSDKTRKPAADYLYQTHRLLGDYRYKETISTDPLVDRYELDGRSAYMLVIPDERGRTGTYQLSVNKGDTAQLYTPKIGSDVMSQTSLLSTTGTVTVQVSETPVFVVTSSDGKESGDLGNVQVYPNPTTSFVNLVIENGSTADVDITVFDSAGRQRTRVNFPKSGRTFTEKVDLASLPYGVYLLDIRQGKARTVKKIIRNR